MALRQRQPCFSLPTSQFSSHPDHSPAPHCSSLGWQLLPQKHPSWAGLQLPTVLPCLAMGPPTHCFPSPALAHSGSQGGARFLGMSLSLMPLAARSWLALWNRPWLPELAMTESWGAHAATGALARREPPALAAS